MRRHNGTFQEGNYPRHLGGGGVDILCKNYDTLPRSAARIEKRTEAIRILKIRTPKLPLRSVQCKRIFKTQKYADGTVNAGRTLFLAGN
jgi:hypothetical protein